MIIHPLIYKKGGSEEEPTGVGHRVRFFDYDGTLLKTEFVEDGGNATVPNIPNPVPATDKNPILIHGSSWNSSVYNIKSDLDVGNIYSPFDTKTHIYIDVNDDTGYTCDMLLYKNTIDRMFVEWGDGSAQETSNSSGNITFSHTYVKKGNYIITFWTYPEKIGVIRIGQGTQTTALFGDNKKFKASAKRIFISRTVGQLTAYSLADMINLEVVSLPSNTMIFNGYVFSNCFRLKHLNFTGSTTFPGALLYNCFNLKNITYSGQVDVINPSALYWCNSVKRMNFPYNLKRIATYCFQGMIGVSNITIPPSVTSIGVYAFSNMQLVNWYKVLPAIPPTISDTTFANCTATCKFYVPDESWSLYNNADYWKDLNLVKMSEFEEE